MKKGESSKSDVLKRCFLLAMVALQLGCTSNQSRTKTVKFPTPTTNVAAGADTVEVMFADRPELVSSWSRFNEKRNYRIANFEDFDFSTSSLNRMRSYDSLWRQNMDRPYIFGDITREGLSTDLAIIVADITAEADEKLSLVVFNAKSDGGYSDAKLILRGGNLATSTLGWAGNWPTLFSYARDGSIEKLFINWHQSSEAYSLDKEPRGLAGIP